MANLQLVKGMPVKAVKKGIVLSFIFIVGLSITADVEEHIKRNPLKDKDAGPTLKPTTSHHLEMAKPSMATVVHVPPSIAPGNKSVETRKTPAPARLNQVQPTKAVKPPVDASARQMSKQRVRATPRSRLRDIRRQNFEKIKAKVEQPQARPSAPQPAPTLNDTLKTAVKQVEVNQSTQKPRLMKPIVRNRQESRGTESTDANAKLEQNRSYVTHQINASTNNPKSATNAKNKTMRPYHVESKQPDKTNIRRQEEYSTAGQVVVSPQKVGMRKKAEVYANKRSSASRTPIKLKIQKGPLLKCKKLTSGDLAIAVLHNVADVPQRQRQIRYTSPSDRYTAFRNSWIRYFKSVLMYRKHHRGANRQDYLKIFSHLRGKYPNKKWYMVVHDDTYVYGHNLLCYLEKYDSNDDLAIGANHCLGEDYKCKSGPILTGSDWIGWINGGAGVVVSAKGLSSMKMKKCKSYYNKHWNYERVAADVVLSCCLKDSRTQKVHGKGFTAGHPGFSECQCKKYHKDYCSLEAKASGKERITYHHIGPNRHSALFRMEYQDKSNIYENLAVFDLDNAKVVNVYAVNGTKAH